MSVLINTLPDDCLLAIFDHVPLSDLLRLDQVHPRWASLLPSACGRRRTLVLLFGGERLDERDFQIPFNDHNELTFTDRGPSSKLPLVEREASLSLPSMLPPSFEQFLLANDEAEGFFDILYHTSLGGTAEEEVTELSRIHTARLNGHLVAYLTELFPKVDTFVAIHPKCRNEHELRSVIDLFGFWSLKILKLWIRSWDIDEKFEDRPDHHPVHTLLQSINRQSTLYHLSLDFDAHGWNDREFAFPFHESFAFIGQLQVAKIDLGWYDRRNAVWDCVKRLNNPRLRRVGLGNYDEDREIQTILNAQFELDFTSKVFQLYWDWNFNMLGPGNFGEFCGRFPALAMLRIHWSPNNVTFTELVTNLASLRQMTHLKMWIDLEVSPEEPFELDEDEVDDAEPRFSLPQVKSLDLDMLDRFHQCFDSLSPLVFPSAETILLNDCAHYSCDCIDSS